MSLSSVHASTQDNTNGTPVAAIVNEDGSGGTIQANGIVGNKSTFATVTRTAITAADTAVVDLSTVGFAGTSGANLGASGNALTLEITATCSVASATLTGRIIPYSTANAPLSLGDSAAISFTSDATRRISAAGNYLCPSVLTDCRSGTKFRFYVESVSAGTWAISVTPL